MTQLAVCRPLVKAIEEQPRVEARANLPRGHEVGFAVIVGAPSCFVVADEEGAEAGARACGSVKPATTSAALQIEFVLPRLTGSQLRLDELR